ncbi:hypothetical protein [Streptomyces sp. NRRL S-378]|uniref:hypothetical protein n=1 Tax=Streptomyces sp. NRRL S-378 TaxID=1463904 RepID=UPI0004CB85C3|nr:hypothetical protein [Streptomyces sp. NRRL S-378]
MAQERKGDGSPLERVTGESDVSRQEDRERAAAPSAGKGGGLQEMADKVKDAAREALGTGKHEPTEATPEAEQVLRERRERSDRPSSDEPGHG